MAAEARVAGRLGWPVAIGGGTAAGARHAARRLIEDGCNALVSFGLAAGLDPALRPGALIVPSAVIVEDADHSTDEALSRVLGGATTHRVVGTNAIVGSTVEKRDLHGRTFAAAADMESGAVAHIATAHAVPFAVLRAVCDPAERALPAAALAALDSRGTIGFWRVSASIVAQPAQLPAMLLLSFDAAAARRSLIARVRQITRAQD